MNLKKREAVVFIEDFPHIQQAHSWDCGLACTQMVLQKFGKPLQSDLETKSLWTIDIAYLLHRHAIPFKLFTKTLGADDTHSSKIFYQNTFNKDERRVNILFDTAEDMGMDVTRRSLTLDEIKEILSNRSPIIILLNSSRIYCDDCSGMVYGVFSWICQHAFAGHYVLLVGYDDFTESILYRDPASNQALCTMKYKRFESARKSPGTDEDLILIQ